MEARTVARIAVVNVCRLAASLTFIFSGFVKAVDPTGTQLKIEDYAEAVGLLPYMPDYLAMAGAIALSAAEFAIGVCLLFAIRRRTTAAATLVVMAAFTAIGVWLVAENPVSDCGCFGDAVSLSNWQSLWKNVALAAMAGVMCRWPTDMVRLISERNQWIVFNYAVVFIVAVSGYSLYKLPPFDFRPYHIGANILQGMAMPEGAEQPQFHTTFIMEKDGRQEEFTLDNYPDSSWTFIDSRTVQTKEGYVPPIHDFSMTMADTGDDITYEALGREGYTFLLIAPHLETADDGQLDRINEVYDYAREYGYPFYCLTASSPGGIARWRDFTGAEYPFCTTDATTLQTMIRSNPGLMLLKDATVVNKWSHNFLPGEEELQGPLESIDLGKAQEDTTARKALYILMWFVLPLMALSIADRLWAWSHWVRAKRKENTDKIQQLLKLKKNEKQNCSR